jgi:putative addiction module component (TIGR02574 family)
MRLEPAKLLEDALSLPAEARSALIESLLESLDADIDENAHEAWREEIQLRLRQIDSGAVKMLPWEDPRRKLRDSLRH